jgi:hypothetical protein
MTPSPSPESQFGTHRGSGRFATHVRSEVNLSLVGMCLSGRAKLGWEGGDQLHAARKEVECLDVAWAYHGEVAAIECRDFGRAKALGGSDDRCVDGAKGKGVVVRDQLCDPQDVLGVDRLQAHLAGREVAEESGFGLPAETTCDQVCDLGNDEGRDDQGTGMSFQQLEASLVMSVVAVYIGVEWPGVNDERYRSAPR